MEKKLLLNFINYDKLEDYIYDIEQLIEDLESDLESIKSWAYFDSYQRESKLRLGPTLESMFIPSVPTCEEHYYTIEDSEIIESDYFIAKVHYTTFVPNEHNPFNGRFQVILEVLEDPYNDSYDCSSDFTFFDYKGTITKELFDKLVSQEDFQSLLKNCSSSHCYKGLEDIKKIGE